MGIPKNFPSNLDQFVSADQIVQDIQNYMLQGNSIGFLSFDVCSAGSTNLPSYASSQLGIPSIAPVGAVTGGQPGQPNLASGAGFNVYSGTGQIVAGPPFPDYNSGVNYIQQHLSGLTAY